MRWKTCLIVCLLALQTVIPAVAAQSSRLASKKSAKAKNTANGQTAAEWPLYGRDLAGSHYNPNEKQITPATVGRLKIK